MPSLSQIEFVGLSGNRVLTILVVNGREVQNRVVQLERHFSAEELRRAAAYLNELFAGQELSGVRARLRRAAAGNPRADEPHDGRRDHARAARVRGRAATGGTPTWSSPARRT